VEQQHTGDAQSALVVADSAVLVQAVEMVGFDALVGVEWEGIDELDRALTTRGAAGGSGHGVRSFEQDMTGRIDAVVDLVFRVKPLLMNEVALEVLAEQDWAHEARGIPLHPPVILDQTLQQ
jgi:hypothetical protein